MAKKDKETIFNEFLADLKSINPKIEEIISDDKVTSRLREGVLARAEFSSSMDALRKEREEMQSYLAEERRKIEDWQKWYGDTSQQFAREREELEAYRDEYGELTDAGKRREAAKHGMTKEEFEAEMRNQMQQLATANLKFVEDLVDIKIKHRDDWKESLNTDELYKIAGEKNLPLGVAYDVMVADKVKERAEKDLEAKLKAAREEGAREFASKHNLPQVTSTNDVVHVLDATDVGKTASDRVAAATRAFLNRQNNN